MTFERSCGVLVHPTSFPTRFGIGDLGPSARKFLDFLIGTNQTVWQILPLGPTGYGDSPYASYSAFAGNHYLISPEVLRSKGLLSDEELQSAELPVSLEVDYSGAFYHKDRILRVASDRFYSSLNDDIRADFDKFKSENEYWLDDYVLFIAIFEHYGKRPWNEWEEGIRKRRKRAIAKWSADLEGDIAYHYWLQYEFANQWKALKSYANERQIKIIGDIPIFVDHNSSDVWAHSKYFEVDSNGDRVLVAGVPPDYFSETGQLWGNPLYKWKRLEKDGFEWWIKRFEQMFNLFDSIRVDHFRGFEAYWEIDAKEETAINGRWVKGPGLKLFDAIKNAIGELPIIAEDLGVLTEEVIDLRDHYQFPGMKILQFAFSDNAANSFLPHNYGTENCVAYTGTHDNDTTIGWYVQGTDLERHRFREYTRTDGSNVNWEMVRLGMFSTSVLFVAPLQDYMNLGTEYRMNYPGTVGGSNWKWRYTNEMLFNVDQDHIRYLIGVTDRDPRVEHEDPNMTTIDAE